MSDKPEGKPSTIEQINKVVRGLVEVETVGQFYWVGGKVERYYKSNLGHVYFNLVDGRKSIRCMLPDSRRGHIEFDIKNDIEIEVLGDVQVYEDRAEIQIQAINAKLIHSNGS